MKTKRNRTKLIVSLAVILVIVLAGVGFLLWQNLQPKADTVSIVKPDNSQPTIDPAPEQVNLYEGWKTYSSSRDGYELKYPAEWIVIPETSHDGPYIRNMQFTGGGYPAGYINLRILRDSGTVSGSNLSINDWYNALGVSTVQKGPVTFEPNTVEPYVFNGLDSKKAKSVFTEIDEDIFLVHGGALYEINMYPYGVTENTEVQKILNSFKFY